MIIIFSLKSVEAFWTKLGFTLSRIHKGKSIIGLCGLYVCVSMRKGREAKSQKGVSYVCWLEKRLKNIVNFTIISEL